MIPVPVLAFLHKMVIIKSVKIYAIRINPNAYQFRMGSHYRIRLSCCTHCYCASRGSQIFPNTCSRIAHTCGPNIIWYSIAILVTSSAQVSWVYFSCAVDSVRITIIFSEYSDCQSPCFTLSFNTVLPVSSNDTLVFERP